jgi:NitT/TauT family transport system ATP-binding protein
VAPRACARSAGSTRSSFFLDILRRGFSDEEARHQLDIAIDWGRYGELYEYDANTGQLQGESRAPEPRQVPTQA